MAVSQLISDAVQTITDAAKDVSAELAPGQTLIQRVTDFQNEVTDITKDLNDGVSNLPAAIAGLTWTDGLSLVGLLVTNLGFTNAHALQIINPVLKLISDLGTANTVPDLLAVIAAVKQKPTQA